MLEEGILVSLGADGAACNNRLDMFTELRTAALLQKAIHGPQALPAQRVLRMATIDGARVLGLGKEIGSLEVGKRADVIVVRMDSLHSAPHPTDLASAITYSAQASDVQTVVIDGRLVMQEGKLLTVDESSVVNEANREAELLMNRAVHVQ
jgi:5-methylthioadenosine/S-adenosylhomocysteine deaminase